MMPFKTLIWKVEDEIGHLVLNQTPANLMTRTFFDELNVISEEILPPSLCKALVIYGGGRHFSAGADTADLKARIAENPQGSNPAELPSFLTAVTRSFQFIRQMNIPTFASIRGTCLGSALELALCCKFRICAEGAVLGLPETTFGIMPGCGGTVMLPAITGRAIAMDLILTGRIFSAHEAYKWGIVHKIADRKNILEETLILAQQLIR
jgi:enoyl-CoA hydratase